MIAAASTLGRAGGLCIVKPVATGAGFTTAAAPHLAAPFGAGRKK